MVAQRDPDAAAILAVAACARAIRPGSTDQRRLAMPATLRVSRVHADARHPARPYAVTVYVGAIVRTERYDSRKAAKDGRRELRAALKLLDLKASS